MNYPKNLSFLPDFKIKRSIVKRAFIKQIKTFTYPLYDIFVVDNPKDSKEVKRWHQNGIKAVHEPIKGDFREELARHQNIIRELLFKW